MELSLTGVGAHGVYALPSVSNILSSPRAEAKSRRPIRASFARRLPLGPQFPSFPLDGDGDCDVDESPPGSYITSGWLDLHPSSWSVWRRWTSPTLSLHTWPGLIGRGTTSNTATTPRAPRLPSSTCCDGKGRNRDANFTTRSLTWTPCPLRFVPQRPASSTRPAATRCSIHHSPSRARHYTSWSRD
jgi:hypothetical protein